VLPPSKQTPAVNALFLESIGPSLALITTSHETAFRETLPSTFKASSRLPKAATNGFLITESNRHSAGLPRRRKRNRLCDRHCGR